MSAEAGGFQVGERVAFSVIAGEALAKGAHFVEAHGRVASVRGSAVHASLDLVTIVDEAGTERMRLASGVRRV